MAEAFLKAMGGSKFAVESAGVEVGSLNPYVVRSMKEIGIDISKNRSKDVFEFIRVSRHFDYVVTVCDEVGAERCPIFPGFTTRLHWNFPDPSTFLGSDDEIMTKIRDVRDRIQDRVVLWIKALSEGESSTGEEENAG